MVRGQRGAGAVAPGCAWRRTAAGDRETLIFLALPRLFCQRLMPLVVVLQLKALSRCSAVGRARAWRKSVLVAGVQRKLFSLCFCAFGFRLARLACLTSVCDGQLAWR